MSERPIAMSFDRMDYKLYVEVCKGWEDNSARISSDILSSKGRIPTSEICDDGELFLYCEIEDRESYDEKKIIGDYLAIEAQIKEMHDSGLSYPEITAKLFGNLQI